MKIILISGKSNSGKGTVAVAIEEILKAQNKHVIRCSLSTYIRQIAKDDFYWDGIDTLESRKFMAEVYRVGTEFYPYHMARRIWERDIKPYAYKNTVVIIESFREKVNYDYFEMLSKDKENLVDEIIAVRVDRPEFNALKNKELENHVSESDLDNFLFDFNIENNGTVEELYGKLGEQIINILGGK
jgi:molybdopterin-guanine dinucleotide biosynthesis protein